MRKVPRVQRNLTRATHRAAHEDRFTFEGKRDRGHEGVSLRAQSTGVGGLQVHSVLDERPLLQLLESSAKLLLGVHHDRAVARRSSPTWCASTATTSASAGAPRTRSWGERLAHAGVLGWSIRYSAPVLHLWHERPYVDETVIAQNRAPLDEPRRTGATSTPAGISHR